MTTADRALWRLGFGLKLFAAFAILTGATDIIDGVRLLIGSGARLEAVAHDPVLNSQIRYLGAVWGGFGAILWWFSNDLQARRRPLEILCAAVFIGGIGRTIAALSDGAGPRLLTFFIVIEFAGPPIVVFMHRKYARS
jgi:hypothetical protein